MCVAPPKRHRKGILRCNSSVPPPHRFPDAGASRKRVQSPPLARILISSLRVFE
jgi:hypothetical protein